MTIKAKLDEVYGEAVTASGAVDGTMMRALTLLSAFNTCFSEMVRACKTELQRDAIDVSRLSAYVKDELLLPEVLRTIAHARMFASATGSWPDALSTLQEQVSALEKAVVAKIDELSGHGTDREKNLTTFATYFAPQSYEVLRGVLDLGARAVGIGEDDPLDHAAAAHGAVHQIALLTAHGARITLKHIETAARDHKEDGVGGRDRSKFVEAAVRSMLEVGDPLDGVDALVRGMPSLERAKFKGIVEFLCVRRLHESGTIEAKAATMLPIFGRCVRELVGSYGKALRGIDEERFRTIEPLFLERVLAMLHLPKELREIEPTPAKVMPMWRKVTTFARSAPTSSLWAATMDNLQRDLSMLEGAFVEQISELSGTGEDRAKNLTIFASALATSSYEVLRGAVDLGAQAGGVDGYDPLDQLAALYGNVHHIKLLGEKGARVTERHIATAAAHHHGGDTHGRDRSEFIKDAVAYSILESGDSLEGANAALRGKRDLEDAKATGIAAASRERHAETEWTRRIAMQRGTSPTRYL